MSSIEAALQEAYAVAPTQKVILHTIELRHPSFIDDEGTATAVRVVRDKQNLTATLESTAPLDPNTAVEFIALGFDFTLPAVRENELPRLMLTIDAVGREVVEHLEAAVLDPQPIDVPYRPSLYDYTAQPDTTIPPEMTPPITLQLTQVSVDAFRISGTCVYDDLLNRKFPSDVYDRERFPALFLA